MFDTPEEMTKELERILDSVTHDPRAANVATEVGHLARVVASLIELLKVAPPEEDEVTESEGQ